MIALAPLVLQVALPDAPSVAAPGLGAQLCVAVWRDAAAFPDKIQDAETAVCVPAKEWKVSPGEAGVRIELGSFATGEHAVSAFLDLDGDGKLRKNVFGMPREPFGFSRDPAVRFSAPRFKDAAFALGPGDPPVKFALARH